MRSPPGPPLRSSGGATWAPTPTCRWRPRPRHREYPVRTVTPDLQPTIELRHPAAGEGTLLHRLARDSDGLDLNSPYAYELGARVHADTSVIALADARPTGFVLGLTPPREPDALFVWQVGVAPANRGEGVALTMLRWLVDAASPRYLEATVTPTNAASRRLFGALARDLGADLVVSRWADADQLGADHEPEDLHRIGPLHRG